MCKAWKDQYDSGKEEDRIYEIFDSVQAGDYGVERGAQKAGMSVLDFEKAMAEAGFNVPACVSL